MLGHAKRPTVQLARAAFHIGIAVPAKCSPSAVRAAPAGERLKSGHGDHRAPAASAKAFAAAMPTLNRVNVPGPLVHATTWMLPGPGPRRKAPPR